MQQASLSSRLVALFLDTLVLAVASAIVTGVVGDEILGISVGFLVGLAYNWYFWTKNNGQTPAKSLMGIRVVKSNGGKLNTVDAVVRYIGYYINTALFFIGWLWAIWDGKQQGFHEKLSGTRVVRA